MSISKKILFYVSEIDELKIEWDKKFSEIKEKITSESSKDDFNKLRICQEQIFLLEVLKKQLNQYANRFKKWEE